MGPVRGPAEPCAARVTRLILAFLVVTLPISQQVPSLCARAREGAATCVRALSLPERCRRKPQCKQAMEA